MTSNPPNIVFILTDDLGWKDLGSTGSEFYETPNIDKLRAEGTYFTNAYASCPVCSPTRASILTGKYPANVGVTDWIDWSKTAHPRVGRLIDAPYIDHLPQSETCLASLFKKQQYATWHVGKWHLGQAPSDPLHHGFDINIGGCEKGSPGGSGYFSPWTDIPALKDVPVPEGTYLTDYLTDQAIHLIKNRDKEQPFYLNMWYYTVHTPIEAKAEKIKKYEKKAHALGLDKKQAIIDGEPFPTEDKQHLCVKRRIIQSDPVYAAMIDSLDENVGRLLQALEEEKIAKQTIIIFTSDNGGLATSEGSPTCNLPLQEGKGWMYEGGTRIPLFITWKGTLQADTVCSYPVTSPDLFPTLLELVGIEMDIHQQIDGISLVPLLFETKNWERDAIYWHYPHYGNQGGTPGSSIRDGDYKLIEFFEDGRLELYNLATDPGETLNLIHSHTEQVESLHQRLQDWRYRMNAKYPLYNPEWKPLHEID
jgi:arylsulfatase A-like enzyme